MIEDVLSKYARHVEFLGDDLKVVEQIGAFGSHVIHLASFANHSEDIEILVRAGANVNAIGDLGLRPLHYAVLGGAIDAATENEFGETPVQIAHIVGEPEMEELLLRIAGQTASGYGGGITARWRWLEFRSMQRENFWSDL
jgi:ankyrin repeat protein